MMKKMITPNSSTKSNRFLTVTLDTRTPGSLLTYGLFSSYAGPSFCRTLRDILLEQKKKPSKRFARFKVNLGF
ncbi:hypothetical protein FO508_03145 [Bacillus pumilus]|uniref:Uncharacterized protein n=1 Tax=Bacillus pumilus TaxID=1408 RepID=A0AAE3WI61_BACPU|nr:hypothetical protein [Bacillus pumilus]